MMENICLFNKKSEHTNGACSETDFTWERWIEATRQKQKEDITHNNIVDGQ